MRSIYVASSESLYRPCLVESSHFLGTPSWDYPALSPRLETYTNAWNKILLYNSSHTPRTTAVQPGMWWDSLLNRRNEFSAIAARREYWRDICFCCWHPGRIAYWQCSQSTAYWVFPMFAVGLFCTIPVEAHRHALLGRATDLSRFPVVPLATSRPGHDTTKPMKSSARSKMSRSSPSRTGADWRGTLRRWRRDRGSRLAGGGVRSAASTRRS